MISEISMISRVICHCPTMMQFISRIAFKSLWRKSMTFWIALLSMMTNSEPTCTVPFLMGTVLTDRKGNVMEKLLEIIQAFEQEPGASVFYAVLRGYPHLKNHVVKYLNSRHKLMAEILLILDQSAPDK